MVSLHESSSIGEARPTACRFYLGGRLGVLYDKRDPHRGRGGRPWSTTGSGTVGSLVVTITDSDTEADAIPELNADLMAWIAGLAGGGKAEVTPFGHHRPLWSIDVVRPGRTVELFAKSARDTGSVLAPLYNLEREAAVVRSLTDLGVPTPAFVGFHPGAQVLVLERKPGRGDFHNLEDHERRHRLSRRFIEVLADLHRHRADDFHLDATMSVPVTDEDHALAELHIAEPLYDAAGLSPEPVITFGRRWMRRHVPNEVDHTCFVQGDTGPGNFVFHGDDVWFVDFEISHFGDPMEDLAAICVRDMVTPIVDLRSLFAQYQSLVDWRLDHSRIRYHRVSKCVRSLMAIVSLAELGHQPGELLTWWAYRALYVRGACQALAEAMGLDFDEVRGPNPANHAPSRSPWTALHDLLDADLADLSRSTTGRDAGDAGEVIRRDVQAAEVLRRVDAFDAAFQTAEKAELERLLGSELATSADGLRQLDVGLRADTLGCDDVDLLRFLSARADRQCFLLRPAMGAMADGHFSPIDHD
jgi:aminoglycoside phosphotransferase (APT) family kinase protein